jgi:hypothetical protein
VQEILLTRNGILLTLRVKRQSIYDEVAFAPLSGSRLSIAGLKCEETEDE